LALCANPAKVEELGVVEAAGVGLLRCIENKQLEASGVRVQQLWNRCHDFGIERSSTALTRGRVRFAKRG
jgi:hypothetical protein